MALMPVIQLGQLAMALYVVLPTTEVPQEVAPVHKVDLILEEEGEVFAQGGYANR